jgi:hypothetical protein
MPASSHLDSLLWACFYHTLLVKIGHKMYLPLRSEHCCPRINRPCCVLKNNLGFRRENFWATFFLLLHCLAAIVFVLFCFASWKANRPVQLAEISFWTIEREMFAAQLSIYNLTLNIQRSRVVCGTLPTSSHSLVPYGLHDSLQTIWLLPFPLGICNWNLALK